MDFYPLFPKEVFDDLGGNGVDLVLPLVGIDRREEKNLHEMNLGDHRSLRMQDKDRRWEDGVFLSGVLKESQKGHKKGVVY